MPTQDDISNQVARLKQRVTALEHQLHLVRADLSALESSIVAPAPATAPMQLPAIPAATPVASTITHLSSAEDKLQLFRSPFRGRTDAFVTSWFSAKTGKKGWGPKTKSWVSPRDVTKSDLLPLSDDVIYQHLKPTAEGAHPCHVGLHPLMDADHCYLLVCDFDKGEWKADATPMKEMLNSTVNNTGLVGRMKFRPSAITASPPRNKQNTDDRGTDADYIDVRQHSNIIQVVLSEANDHRVLHLVHGDREDRQAKQQQQQTVSGNLRVRSRTCI